MIITTTGDIIEADVDALVNTVNCVGVMGRGIALQFKKAFPDNYAAYELACKKHEVAPGRMLVFANGLTFPRLIINFPTKEHWKGQSKIEFIESGLAALTEEVRANGIKSIAIPPLGCGLGGLDWDIVRPMIVSAFADLKDVEVLLYEPAGAPPASRMAKFTDRPKMTTSRAVLVALMARYLSALMDSSMSLLEIHKTLYFAQEAGIRLNLTYKEEVYGPYSTNLRHVLNAIEGHFISGYGDGSDDPSKPINLVGDGVVNDAETVIQSKPGIGILVDRASALIQGFASPYGMELLATVHWVAKQQSAANAAQAVELVHAWSDRKRMFPDRHILTAWNELVDGGWIAGGQ
jgi:O-acetyl-ADP-ribose deacetylase (regulator of RNase III)